ncbi:hypothetical protein FPV67DRAFT_1663750 [Lyophyllum atratum]|nr:hypothetical protein FPV67DRAFT_1663750 [Lyophyllum atratum]
MLTLRPQAPPLRPPDNAIACWRGRSRQVSHTALARQASEERRTVTHRTRASTNPERTSSEKSDLFYDAPPPPPMKPVAAPAPIKLASRPAFIPPPPSLSSSASVSPDYYDSPPSPPRSLEDQVHVAYAMDDIHLAKMLLLRLKGINVTSTDDPRIAEVKDEDFDFCFVPHGRLMDEEDEKALHERQRKESEKLEEKRRIERLRDCERIWEQGKERLREAKVLAARRREAEEKRSAEEQRFVEDGRVPVRRMSRPRPSGASPRPVVTYKLTTASSSQDQEPFVYDFMPCPTQSCPLSRPKAPAQPKSKSPFSRPLFDDSRTVPFSDVLASMQGPLFLPERRPMSPLSTSASQDRKRRREVELLESLLKVVEWEEDERRRRKGKGPAKPPMRRRGSDKSALLSSCAACSSSSSSSSLSSASSPSSSLSPTPSRRSWLSFSSTSSSASTAATTPSSSPPTWFSKSASPTRKDRPNSWFLAPPSPGTHKPSPPHSCKPCTHLTPVSPADSPLPMNTANGPNAPYVDHRPFTTSASSSIPTGASDDTFTHASVVVRRVFQFLELAKGFQNAYMNATMFAISASSDSLDDRQVTAPFVLSVSSRRSTPLRRSWRPLGPPGQRVRAADVKAFLNTSPTPHNTPSPSHPAPPPRPIPLRSRTTIADGTEHDEPPRTVLPNPLPYALHFKPHPVPCRSPFRVHAHYAGGAAPWGGPALHNGAVVLRVRAVENPLYLRVKALGNVVSEGGGEGKGRAREREGAMGSGREKVLQIAYEGIGRSWLGVGSVETRGAEGGVGVRGQKGGGGGASWW